MPAADQYLSTQILTASPYRLHLMVAEGAVRFARLGAEAMESGDIETAHSALSKSRDFVSELIGGLSEEYDQDLSTRMKQLFFFAYVNLAEGERERDGRKVQEALKVLTSHLETWRELGEQLQQDGAAGSPTSPPPTSKPVGGSTQSRAWSA